MTTTGTDGNYNFTLTSADPFKQGSYQVIGYILPGSTLASVETTPVKIQIP